MKKANLNNLFIYKYRYFIGYATLCLSFVAILLYSLFIAPNGLTSTEMNSAADSVGFSLENIFTSQIVNAPFKLLQKASIYFFGLNNIGIKLPAVLISIASLFFIIRLTNAWFSRGIATMASIIAITSSQFFFLSQNGSPEILYVFYPILLIYFGIKFIAAKKPALYGALFMGTLAFSLYSPLTFYILLALFITGLAHPRLRLAVKKTAKSRYALGIGAFILFLIPLLISIFGEPSILKTLLGLNQNFNMAENLKILGNDLFGFGAVHANGSIAPIISFPSLILIGIGIFFTFSERYSAKSYLLNIWAVIMLIVCILNPEFTTILFMPVFLLTVSGLQSLLQSWYTLFPLNPYARIGGLIPVVVLVGGILLVNLNNFQLNYLYSPQAVSAFNKDLELLDEKFRGENFTLITSGDESRFYDIWKKKTTNNLQITDATENTKYPIIVSNAAKDSFTVPRGYTLSEIITSSRAENADRFYIYKGK